MAIVTLMDESVAANLYVLVNLLPSILNNYAHREDRQVLRSQLLVRRFQSRENTEAMPWAFASDASLP